MTRRRAKLHESPAIVSSLGLACLGLLGGCGGAGGGGGGSGGNDDGPIAITSTNAQTLAKAALAVAAIADSLPSSASRSGGSGATIDCAPGTLEITTSGGEPVTITTPSGNAVSSPSVGDTMLDYEDCLEDDYVKSGLASVVSSGGGQRVRWMNLSLEHSTTLTIPSSIVGAANYNTGADTIYRIDDLTATQGSSSFYATGQIDSFQMPRALRFDLLLRFPSGEAQVTSPIRLSGLRGMHFDGGEMLIEGDDSTVTVLPQGGGLYRLEIDADGDAIAETIQDAVAL